MTYIDTTRQPIGSIADLIRILDRTEELLLERHPKLADGTKWIFKKWAATDYTAETQAIALLEKTRQLKEALARPELEAWEAAAIGMAFQDRLMLYRLPDLRGWMAEKEGKGGGRPSQDLETDLAVRVLRDLRGRGLTWEASLAALAEAADELQEIAGVEVDRASQRGTWKFRRGDVEQRYSESTLRRKKFPAARPR